MPFEHRLHLSAARVQTVVPTAYHVVVQAMPPDKPYNMRGLGEAAVDEQLGEGVDRKGGEDVIPVLDGEVYVLEDEFADRHGARDVGEGQVEKERGADKEYRAGAWS